jgi:hypothetical protein
MYSHSIFVQQMYWLQDKSILRNIYGTQTGTNEATLFIETELDIWYLHLLSSYLVPNLWMFLCQIVVLYNCLVQIQWSVMIQICLSQPNSSCLCKIYAHVKKRIMWFSDNFLRWKVTNIEFFTELVNHLHSARGSESFHSKHLSM